MPVYDTANEFSRSLAKVLMHEGGYSNHPADPGGATIKGVTQRVFTGWLAADGMGANNPAPVSALNYRSVSKRYGGTVK